MVDSSPVEAAADQPSAVDPLDHDVLHIEIFGLFSRKAAEKRGKSTIVALVLNPEQRRLGWRSPRLNVGPNEALD